MNDIANWIDECHNNHPSYIEADVSIFVVDLNRKIGQMVFRAANGGMVLVLC